MAAADLDSLWTALFPDRTRPQLTVGHILNEDGFLPLANTKDFAMDLQPLTSQQLYGIASNNQLALQEAQDEYLELEKQINIIKNPDPTTLPQIKNPQALPDHQEFEERKEASLYNYKYDPKKYPEHKKTSDVTEQEKRDSRFDQDPFSQGGFVPTERQFRATKSKAKDARNPDGWTPVERDGRQLIPRMYHEPPKEHKETMTRSKTASLVDSRGRAGTEELDDSSVRGTPLAVNKMLRITRFNGTKVPVTRDASEDPSYPPSRSSTPKRKRGDTPLPSIEFGSPLKKIRATTDSEPPKRKRHNQYTKARELREQAEAEAAAKAARGRATRGTLTQPDDSMEVKQQYDSRASTADLPGARTPVRRKRHNQYTKAKERAKLEAAAEPAKSIEDIRANYTSVPTISYPADNSNIKLENDTQYLSSGSIHNGSLLTTPVIQTQPQEQISRLKLTNKIPIWATMTPAEKLHHKWDSTSLIAAIKDDYTWLPEETDAQKRAERDRLLAQKNPHRSFSIKNKWRFWKKEGLDKRPRKNKAVTGLDGALTGDEAMSTPGPPSENEVDTDVDNEERLGGATIGPAPAMTLPQQDLADHAIEAQVLDATEFDDGIRRSGRAKRLS